MSSRGGEEISLRRFAPSDVARALEIEHQSFPTPWSAAMFMFELSKPDSIGLAAIDDDVLVGYLIAARYAQVWHVMNISVDPANRRDGIATTLMSELFARADSPRSHYTLEVRVSNAAAIAMYEKCGFKSAGTRPGYYVDNREDALIMWRSTDELFVPPNAANPTEWKGHR